MRKTKGQGALEYLLLIGGAVLIAVIVIALLVGMGGQSKDTAQDQTNKAQKVVNTPQSTTISSVYTYQDGDDCIAEGCLAFFKERMSYNVGCRDCNFGYLKLTWDSLSSGGTYIIKVYDYMETELPTNIYLESASFAGDIGGSSPTEPITSGEITDINPVFIEVDINGTHDCQDSYYAQIHTLKNGQTVKSAKYQFTW